MAKARLFITEVGKSDLVQHNGPFASEEEATKEGERLCAVGTVREFEVWTLAGRYGARTTVERIDAEDAPARAEALNARILAERGVA